MSNQGAWIPKAKAQLEVRDAPLPQAGEGEVVIKNHAVAINPVEWKIQKVGIMINKYPNILGCDTAGEVHEVGTGVTHVKKGDRVLAHHYSLLTNNPSHGAFQLYSATNGLVVQKISDFPITKTHTLKLPYPSTSTPKETGKSILVWGGASSVGATAIQLAAASGVRVVSVCSLKNVDRVKALGAPALFDYKSSSATNDILAALTGTEFVGVADCISTEESAAGWTPIYKALGGRWAGVQPNPPGIPEGAQGELLWAASIPFEDRDVGEAVWGSWVSKALENGMLKAQPDAVVVGKGLDKCQEAMDRQMRGVSFEKIVVEF